jgi:hypothetical protein
MRITDLKPEQFKQYFEARMQGHKFTKAAGGYMTKCAFHDEKTASMSVSFEHGVWYCHANKGCGNGGIIDFEKKFSQCDDQQAIANIAEIIGMQLALPGGGSNSGQPEFTWDYLDEMGRLVFQVLRYPKTAQGKKRILQRRPCPDCHNGRDAGVCHNADCKRGWIWKKEGIRKILYRLPEVIRASDVYIVEGEKCADAVRERFSTLTVPDGITLAATTSPEGAGKWLDMYAPYLTGKRVTIFEDHDKAGRDHSEVVAASIDKYAAKVKCVQLPELQEKEDIWEYFTKYNHTLKDAIDVAKNVRPWTRPNSGGTSMFVSVMDFVRRAPRQKNWVIENLIEKGSNGFVIGKPKGAKSWATIDMAIALASGQQWLELDVPEVKRVAHFSREDNPDTTSWRYGKLLQRRQLNEADLADMIYLNTRTETPRFMLDEEEWVLQAIRDMKSLGTEFFILDVLNKCHGADENDNTEMRQIMDRVEYMATETKAQWCIVHHYNKSRVGAASEEATLTEMMRGASAIAGSAEWLVGFLLADEEKHIRQAKFDTKSSLPPQSFYWKINSAHEDVEGISLGRVEYEPPARGNRRRAAEEEESYV